MITIAASNHFQEKERDDALLEEVSRTRLVAGIAAAFGTAEIPEEVGPKFLAGELVHLGCLGLRQRDSNPRYRSG